MEAKFEAGQAVYSEHGEQAEYVAKAGDGHIVRPIVEAYSHDGEDGPYDHVCDPTMWRHVFPQPPVAKYSADLKALHEQIAAAKAERQQIESEDWQRQRERAAKLKKFALLDNVEAFLDGKISHYVLRDSCYSPPTIISVAEARAKESGSWRESLRLLTLGGNLRNGEVAWTLNQYSDGSGGASCVTPCTSYEQATDVLRQEIVKHFADTSPNRTARQGWIDAADKLGIAAPEAYRRSVAQSRIQQIESNMSYVRKHAQDYAESVRKADEELAQLRAYVNPTPATGAA
jgi:hypothetical protein